jgi:hypothetical protein
MHILLLFGLVPFLIGLGAEYAVCRFTMGRGAWRRWLPPAAVAGIAGFVVWNRYRLWTSEDSPVSALLFLPGLPALLALLGLLAGWRLWRRLWRPRVIREK